MALRFPPVSAFDRRVTVPKDMTFCSGVYISAPLDWLIVFAELPSFTMTIIQFTTLFEAVFVTKVKFHLMPTIVHGKVAVFKIVAVFEVVAVWAT